MSKTVNISFAEAADFGATAAERVRGGFNGILFIDESDLSLKVIDEAGAVLVARIAGAPVVFAA